MPLALYLLALAVFAMGTSEFILAGLLPDIATSLDVPVGTAGLLTSAFAIGMVVGAPTMAAVSRHWPARASLLTFLAAFAACHLIAGSTSSFAVVFLTRVGSALANAGFLAVAIGIATRLVAPGEQGRALAVLLSGTTLAMVLGVPAGSLIAAALDWRATFWSVALLCLPAAVGVATAVRHSPTETPERTGPDRPSLSDELAQLSTTRLLVSMLLAALINAGTFSGFTFLAPIVTHTAELTPMWVPMSLVLFGLGAFLGVTIAGRLSDRQPRRVLLSTLPALALSWFLLAFTATTPAALLTLVCLVGLLAFAAGSTAVARVLNATVRAPTMGGSYATAALNVGAAAGPAIGGVALGTGSLGPVWAAGVATTLALILLVPALSLVAPRHR